MKMKPILFSTPMVQAILEGRKTQTRRSVKYNISWESSHLPKGSLEGFAVYDKKWAQYWLDGEDQPASLSDGFCPYGKPGSVLWVREEHYRFGHWVEKEGVFTKTGRQKWMFVPTTDEILFDAPEEFRKGRHHKDSYTPAWHKRLARFMPYSACRLFLRITDIRVERLQDITEEDGRLEGAKKMHIDDLGQTFATYKRGFQSLWDSINGPESWAANPYVWCVSFERIDKPE